MNNCGIVWLFGDSLALSTFLFESNWSWNSIMNTAKDEMLRIPSVLSELPFDLIFGAPIKVRKF